MQRTLLLVDDIKMNREILKNILGDEYGFVEAGNGLEALAVLEKRSDISAVLLDLGMPVMDGFEMLSRMRANPAFRKLPVVVTTGATDQASEVRALKLGANDYISKPYNATITKQRIWNAINLYETAGVVDEMRHDSLTGLYNRAAFLELAQRMIAEREPGYYIMASFDIDNFKIVNDQYGSEKGDEVLRYVSKVFSDTFDPVGGVCCRISADNFAVLYPRWFASDPRISEARERASEAGGLLASPIAYSVGRYVVDDLSLSGSAMYDRAMLAEAMVKGRYDAHVYEYSETLRQRLLSEQQIIADMRRALSERQYEMWLQPQYNHITGALIGAEALVRWRHPQKGLMPPGQFIPVFERNGFIYELDKFIWEEACRCLRMWLDEGRKPLPISVNVSRYDVFRPDLIETIRGLLHRYELAESMLRLEITESAFARNAEQIIAVVKQLIELGFTVEIDDFGSGYSSLNTLKDVPAQVLKLDMRFLENDENSQRGGNILESVVRMAKWLGMSVIAEGVETLRQADYLRSIGCGYMQGFLYARPMPISEYESLAKGMGKEERLLKLETVENLDNQAFWDPKSMDTLIFNSYVGGASISEYCNGKLELLRVNEKFVATYGAGLSNADLFTNDVQTRMDDENFAKLMACVRRAVETGQEETCETVERGISDPDERLHIRATLRVIARAGDRCLLYSTVLNVTQQREAEQKRAALAEQLSTIMENINAGVSVVVEENGHLMMIFANDRFYADFGHTSESFAVAGVNAFQYIHPDDIGQVKQHVRQICIDHEPYQLEYRVIREDGSEIWLNGTTCVIRYPGVDIPVYLSVCTDVTTLKQAERSLRESDEQLRFLNREAHALLAQPDSEQALHALMQHILDYFDGTRAHVFEIHYERGTITNTYDVCADGVESCMVRQLEIPLAQVHASLGRFDRSQYIVIDDINNLDEDLREESERLRARISRSMIAVPLMRDDCLIGSVGVDDPRRNADHLERLVAMGDFVTVLLTRRDLDARIRQEKA